MNAAMTELLCTVTNSKGQECGRDANPKFTEGVCGAHQHRMDRDGTYDADRPIRTYTKRGLNRSGPRVPGETDRDKFFARVLKRYDGHWDWMGAKVQGGTGILSYDAGKRSMSAPRFSWELVNGTAPAGSRVRTACDRPRCINPAHLELTGAYVEMQVAA